MLRVVHIESSDLINTTGDNLIIELQVDRQCCFTTLTNNSADLLPGFHVDLQLTCKTWFIVKSKTVNIDIASPLASLQ